MFSFLKKLFSVKPTETVETVKVVKPKSKPAAKKKPAAKNTAVKKAAVKKAPAKKTTKKSK
jgi:hypothetical protein